MTDRRLLLVRHGVTDWNREGRFQGHLDPPLSESGRHEAVLLAERVAADPDLRPARIIASSLGRALETAQPLADAVGTSVEPEPRLMEIGQGEWEGRTHAELEVDDAERYRAWRDAAGLRQPPGGETLEAAALRITTFLAELTDSAGRWPVCLVSHGGALRILAHSLLALNETTSLDVDNASLGVATRVDGRWRLDRWNDTRHLLGRERTHVDEAEGRPLAL